MSTRIRPHPTDAPVPRVGDAHRGALASRARLVRHRARSAGDRMPRIPAAPRGDAGALVVALLALPRCRSGRRCGGGVVCVSWRGTLHCVGSGDRRSVRESRRGQARIGQRCGHAASYIFSCTFEPHDAAWTIENVATLPRFRKRGLAGELIRHVLPGRQTPRHARSADHVPDRQRSGGACVRERGIRTRRRSPLAGIRSGHRCARVSVGTSNRSEAGWSRLSI